MFNLKKKKIHAQRDNVFLIVLIMHDIQFYNFISSRDKTNSVC